MSVNTEIYFTAWGAWHRGHSDLLLSKLNIIGRCMIEGAGASHSTVKGLPHMPFIVEVTERCVLTLPKHAQRAVKHYYIGEESIRNASKKMKCSRRSFENKLDFAHRELSDFLVETA